MFYDTHCMAKSSRESGTYARDQWYICMYCDVYCTTYNYIVAQEPLDVFDID